VGTISFITLYEWQGILKQYLTILHRMKNRHRLLSWGMTILVIASFAACAADGPSSSDQEYTDTTAMPDQSDSVILAAPEIPLTEEIAEEVVPEESDAPDLHPTFHYRLNKPDRKWKLKNKLQEISGLTLLEKGVLACVQDEDGLIFRFDTRTGKIEGKSDFGKDGDYEGIAMADDHMFVVRSNGDLYRVKELSKDPKKKHYETALNGSNDVEGLCYQVSQKRLLVACKGFPGKGKKLKHRKAIYAFDPKKKELSDDPVYTIDLKQLADSIDQDVVASAYGSLAEFFNPGDGELTFQPSAIAVHPISEQIYLLSSAGKLMVILSPEGEVEKVLPLDRSVFKQPEGLAFEKDGTMYISNEGRGGHANILRFDYQH